MVSQHRDTLRLPPQPLPPCGKSFLDIQPAQNASVGQPQVMCWGCIIQVCPLCFGREGTSMAQDPGKKLDQMGL